MARRRRAPATTTRSWPAPTGSTSRSRCRRWPERFGVETVRVDSGGALTGALLDAGLVDEVSLLVHPLFAGPAGDRRWHGGAAPPAGALELVASEALDGGLVWSRYRVDRAYAHP